MQSPFEVSVAVDDFGLEARVVLGGEVDIAAVPCLRRALSEQVKAGRHTTVDLAGVTFMDGSGISVLVSAHKAAEKAGLVLRLVNADHRPLTRLLAVTGVDRVLRIE